MVVFLQLKLPGADPAQAVAYSMFLRVPPPEDRKDYSRHLYQTLNCSDNLTNSIHTVCHVVLELHYFILEL